LRSSGSREGEKKDGRALGKDDKGQRRLASDKPQVLSSNFTHPKLEPSPQLLVLDIELEGVFHQCTRVVAMGLGQFT